jgi:hypothetical protein
MRKPVSIRRAETQNINGYVGEMSFPIILKRVMKSINTYLK